MDEIRKGCGYSFNKWIGYIPNKRENKIRYKVLRDYYNDNLTPKEVYIKEGLSWEDDSIQNDI